MKNSEFNFKIVGNNIVNSRKRKNLSQRKLAKAVGISPSYLSKIEIGKQTPSLDVFIKILNELNESANFIFSDLLTYNTMQNTYCKKCKIHNLNEKQINAVLELVDEMIKEL